MSNGLSTSSVSVQPIGDAFLDRGLQRCLLILRLSIAAFMAQWAIGRFLAPDQSNEAIRFFFHVKLESGFSPMLGSIQLVIIACFVASFRRWVSYGLVLLMNAAAVLATWQYIIDPYGSFEHRLFWNGVPVVAACFVLFRLRRFDTIWSLDTLLERTRSR